MQLRKSHANGLLLLAALIWGTSYTMIKVTTRAGMPAGLLNGIRGAIFLALVYGFFHRQINHMTRAEFKLGFAIGFFYFCVIQLQTIGLKFTTPSNSAFLTASYVVMVPFVSWLILHKRPAKKAYFSTFLCLFGMMILTGVFQSGFQLHGGDGLTITAALFCALQIVFLEYATGKARPMVIAFMTALCETVFGLGYSVSFEHASYARIIWPQVVIPIILLAVFASFGGQILQIVGQRFTDSISAGLILMLESVFASIFSVSLGVEPLTPQLLIGGGIIFISLLMSQFNFVWLFQYVIGAHRKGRQSFMTNSENHRSK